MMPAIGGGASAEVIAWCATTRRLARTLPVPRSASASVDNAIRPIPLRRSGSVAAGAALCPLPAAGGTGCDVRGPGACPPISGPEVGGGEDGAGSVVLVEPPRMTGAEVFVWAGGATVAGDDEAGAVVLAEVVVDATGVNVDGAAVVVAGMTDAVTGVVVTPADTASVVLVAVAVMVSAVVVSAGAGEEG